MQSTAQGADLPQHSQASRKEAPEPNDQRSIRLDLDEPPITIPSNRRLMTVKTIVETVSHMFEIQVWQSAKRLSPDCASRSALCHTETPYLAAQAK